MFSVDRVVITRVSHLSDLMTLLKTQYFYECQHRLHETLGMLGFISLREFCILSFRNTSYILYFFSVLVQSEKSQLISCLSLSIAQFVDPEFRFVSL